jgi:site-specific recombinase XerD
MITTFALNFSIKKTKILADGTAPIYIRLTIEKDRIEFTTRRYIVPDRWNAKSQKMIGSNEEAKSFNSCLKALEQQVYEAHRLLVSNQLPITVQILKDKILGEEKAPEVITIIPVFEEHNKKMKVLVGKEYAEGTMKRYETSLKHTSDFIKWKYKTADFVVKNIDYNFVSNYDFYLRSERKCCNNSAVKYLKNFKKVIKICLGNGWLEKDPFLNYKIRITEVIPEYLTKTQLKKISDRHFENDRINQVKDVFLFSCYTGLAYVDVQKLRRDEIVIGVDGQKWVFTNRQKTDSSSRIPLLPKALEILEKYADHPKCLNEKKLLPVLCNQKMNAYLREVADLCGIKKSFTYHTARHTFATTVTLSNGVPIETVSKMLGHKNLKTTQHYAKILDMKVSEDMKALVEKLEI